MISYDGLQDSIVVSGIEYRLNTDYRVWLKFQEGEAVYTDLFMGTPPVFFIDGQEFIPPEAFAQIVDFMRAGEEQKESAESEKIIDFKRDSDFIYASFLQAYSIDLIQDTLHYHQFLALFKGLPEDTVMAKIIGYRTYDGKDEDMKKLKAKWALPRELSEEEQKAGDYFESLFG